MLFKIIYAPFQHRFFGGGDIKQLYDCFLCQKPHHPPVIIVSKNVRLFVNIIPDYLSIR